MTRESLVCLSVFSACALASCKSEEPGNKPPPPLDERLGDDHARAGLITRSEELITGVTAKGRLGDFKIYNSKIAVVIAQTGFARGYQPFGGNVLDADRVRPAGEPGHTTFGEIISGFDFAVVDPEKIEVQADGQDGGPAILRVTGKPKEVPLFQAVLSELIDPALPNVEYNIDYVLEPGADVLRIVFRLRNAGDKDIDLGLPLAGYLMGDGAAPFASGFGFAGPSAGNETPYYAAVSPEVSYIYGRADAPTKFIFQASGLFLASLGEGFAIRARDRAEITHLLVIGDGDFSKTQEAWQKITGAGPAFGSFSGVVKDEAGAPLAGARVHVMLRDPPSADADYVTIARTDQDGAFTVRVPPAAYKIRAVTDQRLASAELEVPAIGGAPVSLVVKKTGALHYTIKDEAGALLPVKLSLVRPREDGVFTRHFGEEPEPSGTFRAEYGFGGTGTVHLPPGVVHVIASRGSEYEIFEADVTIEPGQTAELSGTLARTTKSAGWMSTDTHIHAQLSPDSGDFYPFKVATMVTEGLELPVSTEHEAIGDFNPTIKAMGLEAWIHGIVGSEITTFSYGHFNAFPLVQDLTKPGNGRIDWFGKKPGDTFAAIRANPGDPFLQVNHPRSAAVGGYFSAMGYDRDRTAATRVDQFSTDFDGIEVANGCEVDFIERETMPDWFSFLNKGQRKVAMGSTDSHHAGKGEMGYPKTFLHLGGDDPKAATIDAFRAAAKEGRAVVSCGPFLKLEVGTAQIGDTVRQMSDLLRVTATVSAPSWMDVDQVELLVNGQLKKVVRIPEHQGALDWSGTLTASVSTAQDGWAILRVRGDRAHGVWANGNPSYAFTNPVFLDANGDGWKMP